jgi:hypothetical protein
MCTWIVLNSNNCIFCTLSEIILKRVPENFLVVPDPIVRKIWIWFRHGSCKSVLGIHNILVRIRIPGIRTSDYWIRIRLRLLSSLILRMHFFRIHTSD